jgi:hypothetical protein
MRGKAGMAGQRGVELPARDRRDIAEDLERLGIPRVLLACLAERLDERCRDLDPAAYEAALEGVVAAFDATGSAEVEDVREIQRLMEGFADELQKLEEGLRIVSAYAIRMQERAIRDRQRFLH